MNTTSYAIFEVDLLRGKIIRRIVRTAVGLSWLVGVGENPIGFILPTKHHADTDQFKLGY